MRAELGLVVALLITVWWNGAPLRCMVEKVGEE